MHAPLAHHLRRFSHVPPAGASAMPPPQAPAVPAIAEPTVTMTVAALEARLEDAARRLRAELEVAHAAERTHAEAVQAEAMAAAVATASAKRDAAEGEAIVAELRSSMDMLRASVCETLATALRPLFAEAAAAKATAELAEALRLILADPDQPVLTLKGPPTRLAAIKIAFGAGAALAFVDDEGADEIVATANGLRIETRLADAMAALAGSA